MSANLTTVSQTAGIAGGTTAAATISGAEEKLIPRNESIASGDAVVQKKIVAAVASTRTAEEEQRQASKVAGQLNEIMSTFDKGFRFKVYENTKQPYIEIYDESNGKVVRTIPSREMLDMVARIQDAIGLIVDVKG